MIAAKDDVGSKQLPPVVAIVRTAGRQHGVITRAQAIRCGVADRTVDRRLETGIWERLYPGVYRLTGSPATWRQSVLAACFAWGPGVAASHTCAAALRELPSFPETGVELSVPRNRRRSYRHRIHRPLRLDAADVTVLDAIPVTTMARTLMDIAGCVALEVLEDALDEALRRRSVSVAQMQARLQEIGVRGRAGFGVLDKLLCDRSDGTAMPQSVFETRVLRVLRKARLPLPACQYEIRTPTGLAILDFAYVRERIAIEADGFRWHSSRHQWDRDRARGNALMMLRWKVIRVTWTDLRDRPGEFVATVRSMLAESTRL